MAKRRNFIIGKISLSKEHVELSNIAGVDREQLVDQYLSNIEKINDLIPDSLLIYYYEMHKSYTEYWYTEYSNTKFLREFELKVYSFDKISDPLQN